MRTIKTNGKELIAVEVPMESTMHWINSVGGFMYYKLGEATEGAGRYEGFEILGTLTDGKADFDVEPYVDSDVQFNENDEGVLEDFKEYRDYKTLGWIVVHDTAIASFLSLLQSQGIEYANKKLIFLLKR